MAGAYNYDDLASLWHRYSVFGPPIDEAIWQPTDFYEWLNTEPNNHYSLPDVEHFIAEKERREGTAFKQEFDREQAIQDYARLMEAGPLAENEEELRALVEQAYAQRLYFDYDRGKQTYVLVPGETQESKE